MIQILINLKKKFTLTFNSKELKSLVKSFEQLNDVNLIMIQKNEFENMFSNGLLLKYCILMDKYKKNVKCRRKRRNNSANPR